MLILTILIFQIHEHSVSFHLQLDSSLISFINVVEFSEHRYFTSSVRFIPGYFIIFDVMINVFVFLNSPSDSSLLMNRNTTDYCTLILYSATLPNPLMNCSGFLVVSLGFPMYSIITSASNDSFLSFPIWIRFTSFSCVIAVARTSNTVLNKSGTNGRLFLFLSYS